MGFQKQWYSDKCDLLHDIICMANNLENRDAYIIVGIDEKNNFRFIDVSKDSNRKNTQMLVDFLKDKICWWYSAICSCGNIRLWGCNYRCYCG